MKALDRKLLRDLRTMWSQVLTIALVVASGAGGFLTSLSAIDSLADARDIFYAQGHFADIFVTVKRAPLSLVEQLRGVAPPKRANGWASASATSASETRRASCGASRTASVLNAPSMS